MSFSVGSADPQSNLNNVRATPPGRAVVGTPGIGPGTFALYFCDAYPRNAWPKAVIEYPAKDGGKPIVTTVRLDDN